MITALGGLLDASGGLGFWGTIASLFSAGATMLGTASTWAGRKARKPEPDALDALTHRLRHPVRAALASPLVTIRRKVDRRRQA